MSTVKLSKVLSELPSKDSVADNDNFVLSSYQKLPASQLATAEQLSAAKQTAADGLTTLKSALKGIANTDCARVVITESGNYAVTTNLDALNDFFTAVGLYAITNARGYVYGHMLIGSTPMFHGTVQWLFGNWNVEDGKLMVSHSDGCVTIVYRVYPRSDKQWSDWKYYQQNFIKEADDSLQGGEWTYNHTAIDAIKTSLQAAIDTINTDKQKLWDTLQDVDERDRDAIGELDVAVRTNTTDIATNAAAIAALDAQVNDTRHHLIVKTTKDLTIAIDGKSVTIPAKKKTEIYFEKSIGDFPANNNAVCHFQLLNTKGMTNYPRIRSGIIERVDVRDWDVSQVANLISVFGGLTNVKELDLSGWDTSKVTSLQSAFQNCTAITSLDLRGWDTSKVTTVINAWNGCTALKSLNLSGWDTTAITNMFYCFFACTSLESLDLSGWDTTNVADMRMMFFNCSNLRNITLGEKFFAYTNGKEGTDFGLKSCSHWTNDTVRTSLVTNLYDRAANGLDTITLQLHANTKAVLSTEDKEYITSKGYIIA